MSWRLLGSRSRRAAVLGLLCTCAVLARAGSASAQEMVVSDGVIAGDLYASCNCDGGYGCSTGDCYGGCDSCMTCDGCNSCNTCDSCGGCGSDCCSGWFGAEYLGWTLEGNRIPALVTRGPLDDYPGTAGQLGQPATEILSGHEEVNDGWRNGYRFFGGFWLDCCHTCGIGADYFNAGNDDYNYTSPEGDYLIGRPFFNTESGLPDVELVSVPDELAGTAHVRSDDNFQGAGITLNRCLWRCCDPCSGSGSGVSVLGGYRYYKYDTNLSITERLEVLEGTQTQLVPGTTFFVQDRFRTENEFNGGEIGLQGYKKHCWWWVDGMAKLGIGTNTRTVRINGTTIVSVPDDDTTVNRGGLLTSEFTNIGRYRNSDFALIPEFRLGVGACVTRCMSVRAGYNVILWNDVVRAGSELPPGLAVDPNNLPPSTGGGPDPAFPGIRGSQLVAHGLDASVQFQW